MDKKNPFIALLAATLISVLAIPVLALISFEIGMCGGIVVKTYHWFLY